MSTKIIAIITESGIEVNAENWEGVSNVMLEHVHYAIVRKFHALKAQKLGAVHARKMEAEAASRKTEASKNLTEEIANVQAK